jgi:uncharacterized protein DUF3536/glycosyl hydrolase family 57
VSRGRLVIHGHFYQPSRVDPFTGRVPRDPTAAPAHDWNARISEECYRPNAELGNYGHLSWDLGPTLATWLERRDPVAYRGFVAGDRGVNGLAQAFHHTILPLASAADRTTEIRWGLRDFELRFGRPATGMWLPETAVDLPTLRLLADAGVRFTVLAPWQTAEGHLDTRRPYRVELGAGRSIVVTLYDADLSAAVSFEPRATADADRFSHERIEPRLASGTLPDDEPPLVVIATDGELYGHHQPFRQLFLERLVQPGPDGGARGYDVVPLETALTEPPDAPFRSIRIAERTSWSCHHGVLRWSAECPCVADGRWKGLLRVALERLAAAIDVETERISGGLPGAPDPWAARDAYVDVVIGAERADAFARRWVGDDTGAVARFGTLMAAQRWRLAMFASDGWFWDDPTRPETAVVLRSAARAVRLVDGITQARLETPDRLEPPGPLETRLLRDLALLTSPGHGTDGAAIYAHALAAVGQPYPAGVLEMAAPRRPARGRRTARDRDVS